MRSTRHGCSHLRRAPQVFFVIKRQPDRYHPASLKRYGFFFAGLEPEFWWWDLIVPRAPGRTGKVEHSSIFGDLDVAAPGWSLSRIMILMIR